MIYDGSPALLAALAAPVVVTAFWFVRPVRPWAERLGMAAALPALLAALVLPTGSALALPGVLTGIAFELDAVGRVFLLLAAVLWTAAAIFANGYIAHDVRRPVFFGFFHLTMAGNFGVALAADVVGFYVCFAVLTFAAYGLIVHDRTAEAKRAGRVYIALAVLGEALLLAGLLLAIGFASESPRFVDLHDAFPLLPRPGLVAALLAAGFAVKAGLVPLHLWLPLAHPVAPTPASALLSGTLIKAGLLGWIRFLPLGAVELPGLGTTFIAAGLAGALLGVLLGVLQPLPKVVLAYSSISQMGYMAIAVGAALLVPAAAPAALAAATLFAVHHGLAKGALFLSVAAVPDAVARMRRLAIAFAALPALALAGAPLTSGALAKSWLTQSLGVVPSPWVRAIDILLTCAAVGTTLLMARFLAVLDTTPAERERARLVAPWLALVALGAAGALWIPLALQTEPGLDLPGPFRGFAKAAWPVLLGALLAGAALRFRARFAHLARLRVPAGDIWNALEKAGSRIRGAAPAAAPPHDSRLRRLAQRASGRIDAYGGRVAARDAALGAGDALGALLAIVALLLLAALSVQ